MTADDTKGEDSPKTTKKRRRRRRKKTTKGVEKRAALEYQLVLEQQKNQALEKNIREQTTKTDGLTTELTKLLSESKVDLLQEAPSFGGFLSKLILGLIQAKLSSDRPLSAHAHGPVQRYDSFPRPLVGYVGYERLTRRREFARVHRLMDS